MSRRGGRRAAAGSWSRLKGRFARGQIETGSAIAEFVMVAALLMFVALAVFQLGLALYIRNALVAAASEGARFAARADASTADGVSRTRSLITASLGEAYARHVSAAGVTEPTGVRVVEVTVQAPLPVVGPLGPSGALTITGRAFAENQVAGTTQ